ncbi:MAG: flagellar biosynthetic protein FliO [Lachnospiraceae bacterium]
MKYLYCSNSVLATGVNGVVQFIVALLMLAFVVVLCYFTTRFIANYHKGTISKGNIEILEAKNVGSNKLIEIVRIGDEYFAIGVGKDNITLISKIDKNTLVYEKQEQIKAGESFSRILEKIKNTKKSNDNK